MRGTLTDEPMIRHAFVGYSLLAALFWGLMSVAESVAGQTSMHAALSVKYLLYGVAGTAFVVVLAGGFSNAVRNVVDFARTAPRVFTVQVASVLVGVLGTYFAYRAFACCGDHKGLAVIISYCVPVVIVATLSYLVLRERYNGYALLGVMCVVGGVILIDYCGIERAPLASSAPLQKAGALVAVD